MDYQKLGFVAIERGDYQEAVNIFKRALEKGRSARNFIGLGKASHSLGDYPTARWAFHKALALEPLNEEAIGHIAAVESHARSSPQANRRSLFRVGADCIEILDEKWKAFFVKGINLGLGLPGYFPGEYAIKEGTYLKWFQQMTQIGLNTVRLYTIHPPSFYEALYEFNASGKRLYLLQGIWVELPKDNIFSSEQYVAGLKQDIRNAVDIIYGNAHLPERPGYPHGSYTHDISSLTVAFIYGREWESCAVKGYNEEMGRGLHDYDGRFLSVRNGTPFERWLGGMCDSIMEYEDAGYDQAHPVSTITWPTLDPLIHPSESDYEKELALQGVVLRQSKCNENEDMESLDLTKFSADRERGFFATYHAYPYYPDFMNHDYLGEENTYLAYLRALKRHHREQAILVAEFGVPGSRDVSHWHRDGWHQGGHTDTRQGEINGLLMKTIHGAGLAGGVLFAWFDEWYKRNWVFSPYEVPAERNRFWFNLQDAEQNYGLLATYPGYPDKKVKLAGRPEDWENAVSLYERNDDPPLFRFDDGFDDARALSKILAQHDEGFLYLLVETRGTIDFRNAHYMIGLDTCCSESGEFLFPFETKLQSPVGLKFIIHIAGPENSRIMACKGYDKYLNTEKSVITPGHSDQGVWVTMHNKTNARRISKDGKRFFPSRVFNMSALRFGSLENERPHYDSLSDFFCTGNLMELRIPWGLINFTDPSSKTVLWKDANGMTRKTDGIKIVAASYRPKAGSLLAERTRAKHNATDHLPTKLIFPEDVRTYSWETWDMPVYHSYLKEDCVTYSRVLAEIAE